MSERTEPRQHVQLHYLNPAGCFNSTCRGAQNFQEWFDFIGLIKDKRFPPTGSPFQMDFPPEEQTPGQRMARRNLGLVETAA